MKNILSYYRLSPDRYYFAIGWLCAFAVIVLAWGFQLIGGYIPCDLCYGQRIPYYILLVFIFPVSILALYDKVALLKITYFLVMLASFGLAVHHAGVEWRFWPGPDSCGNAVGVLDSGNLLQQLKTTRVVSCIDAAGRFLGLSFAGWNAVASLFIAGIFGQAYRKSDFN